MYKNKVISLIIFFLIILLGAFVHKNNNTYRKNNNFEFSNISVNDKRVILFNKKINHGKVLKVVEENLTDDGKKELIVVYKKNKEQNEMVVISDSKGEIYITKPIKAPKENIDIKFKNIDNKGVMEIIVSGSKNGKIGYAVYRLENKNIIDLFGEGMNDCC